MGSKDSNANLLSILEDPLLEQQPDVIKAAESGDPHQLMDVLELMANRAKLHVPLNGRTPFFEEDLAADRARDKLIEAYPDLKE